MVPDPQLSDLIVLLSLIQVEPRNARNQRDVLSVEVFLFKLILIQKQVIIK